MLRFKVICTFDYKEIDYVIVYDRFEKMPVAMTADTYTEHLDYYQTTIDPAKLN